MRVYWAAPLFSQAERIWNRALAAALAAALPGTDIVLPQDFRTGGRLNDARHYGVIYRRCLEEIRRADAVLAVLDGGDADSGASFEIGYACALGIPVVGLRTDYRPGADQGVNLMCAKGCRYVIREFSFQERPAVLAAAVARRLRKLKPRPPPPADGA